MNTGYNITIIKGNDFFSDFTVRDSDGAPLNLVGYAGRGVIRHRYGSTGVLGTFDVSFPIPLSGIIWYQMAAANTTSLPVTQGRHELEITDQVGTVRKYFYGLCDIEPELNY